jgi:flagellar motor switch protein FliN/FliY
MGDMLSQDEIDALLKGDEGDAENTQEIKEATEPVVPGTEDSLTSQESDALGEIGNISMGTSATTLFTLLGQKVTITTPQVIVTNWEELAEKYEFPVVVVRVEYKMGLIGSNLMILQQDDVKIIADLMMGGDGTNISGDLSDLHLSAISEAMNQMVGSASTSMSSMFNKKIDIMPPKALSIELSSKEPFGGFEEMGNIVIISFKMVVGDLIDSEIMQILPLSFAKDLVDNLMNADLNADPIDADELKGAEIIEEEAFAEEPALEAPARKEPPIQQPTAPPPPGYQQPPPGYQPPPPGYQQPPPGYRAPPMQNIDVQQANFQSFTEAYPEIDKNNISLIMDVPLQVTVELGRTEKYIREVLEFSPGSIIELDKLAGEPVDVIVNGKKVAKGEVVVIDESFGVRITDIVQPSHRF